MWIYGLVLVVHLLLCFVLIGVTRRRGGRGGLSEALGGAAAQSLFGGGTKTVLTKATAVCAGLFVVTCLSLAYLSTMRGRSVIEQVPLLDPGALPIPLAGPSAGAPPPVEPVQPPDTTQPPAAPSEPPPSP